MIIESPLKKFYDVRQKIRVFGGNIVISVHQMIIVTIG